MLRLFRHLAHEGPRHTGDTPARRLAYVMDHVAPLIPYFPPAHQRPSDRCAPPAAPDPVTPAPPTWLAQFMFDAGRGHLPSQSHRPFIIDGGGS